MKEINVMKNEAVNKEIIQWALQTLASLSYPVTSDLYETIQSTPWSYVVRFDTSAGYIYLKHTPELLALEPTVIRILHDQFHVSVPEIIAHNAKLNCFLMKDAGRPLREVLKKKFDVTLYCKAINNFTSMQVAISDHVNVFLDRGVPDWRLDKLPDLYMQLLLQRESLIADGLSEDEITELETLLPILKTLCQKLSDYGIKPSIVQPDFHDNNVLITKESQQVTLIDLGEIAISHPFFSLSNCLYHAKRQHGLTDQDSDYHDLIAACLHPFQTAVSKQEAFEALALATDLSHIYQALAYYRLMLACDRTHLDSLYGNGRLIRSLKQFLSTSIKESKQ
jgi:hypothetical protein